MQEGLNSASALFGYEGTQKTGTNLICLGYKNCVLRGRRALPYKLTRMDFFRAKF